MGRQVNFFLSTLNWVVVTYKEGHWGTPRTPQNSSFWGSVEAIISNGYTRGLTAVVSSTKIYFCYTLQTLLKDKKALEWWSPRYRASPSVQSSLRALRHYLLLEKHELSYP